MRKLVLLAASHAIVAAAGIAGGIYLLPILAAPEAPTREQVTAAAAAAAFTTAFRRDLAGSDLLHWGEGDLSVGPRAIALMGRIAPGPAYRLYLAPEFVENGPGFVRVKERSVAIGEVKTFENFIVPVPETVDVSEYAAVVIWCEAFSQFITAAKYR